LYSCAVSSTLGFVIFINLNLGFFVLRVGTLIITFKNWKYWLQQNIL